MDIPTEMGFKSVVNDKSTLKNNEKISQEQVHNLVFGKELSWQSIIYDLINTEQLDPWDIDLVILTQKYLEKIRELEEADFIVSGKVLLAASLLLRMKSDILLNKYIRDIDDILFNRKKDSKKPLERIELDENEVPDLFPRTPIPRFRKVTLNELISALDNAMNTETRRIKKEILNKNALRESSFSLPRRKINIHQEIKKIYSKIRELFNEEEKEKLSFTELAGMDKKARIATFLPLLHLDNMKKVWLEQEGNFEEIWILLYEIYNKRREEMKNSLMQEIEQAEEEISEKDMDKIELLDKIEEINSDFENPLNNEIDNELEE